MKHFKLPDLGEGLQEAEIVEWHVKAGDSVRADQRLVSVETAKALVDIPAPYDGVVGKLFGAVQQKGYACVALSMYWKKHLVKCEIALAKGKKDFDKRHTEKERDSDREIQRAMRHGKDD